MPRYTFVLAMMCLGACGQPSGHGSQLGGRADGGTPGSTGPGSTVCNVDDPAASCTSTGGSDLGLGVGCGAQTFAISVSSKPPNVFLLVDRSGSMSDGFGGATTGTKWDALQTALGGLLSTDAGKANWGLSLFPPDPSQNVCGKAQIDVALAAGDEAAILAKVNALTDQDIGNPRGSTPTADALATVRDDANLAATDRNNYVVLMTDGIPECNDPSTVAPVIQALYARTPSVRTFVVGIGSDTASDPDLLNAWAVAGGTALNAPTKYYQANDANDLVNAFGLIIGQAASCTFTLASTPPDPSLLTATFNGSALPENATNGFTYDTSTNSITLHGTACTQLQSGAVQNVGVVYGCPPSAGPDGGVVTTLDGGGSPIQ